MSNPFRAYDIRGLIGSEITSELAYKVGIAYVEIFHPSKVIVGHDMRKTSPEFSEALIDGLTRSGCEVLNIGFTSTDMFYLAVITQQTDGGLMVTASHNPARYNGIKIVTKNAMPVGLGSGLEKIEAIINKTPPISSFKSSMKNFSFKDRYVDLLFEISDLNPDLVQGINFVIDTGNGMGGYVMPAILERLPIEVEKLYFELDGTFPNHEANPLIKKNRIDLENKSENLNIPGLGLDGDADRAFFVDENGDFINGDFILGILSEWALKKYTSKLVTYDVRCSDFVRDYVENLGGKTQMGKVGHAYAKHLMMNTNSSFGGEVSGHYYYKYQNAYFDSGPLTFLVLLKMLSEKRISLQNLMKPTSNYFISGEINYKVDNTDMLLDLVEKKYEKYKVIKTDGLRVESKNWWFSIRKSNTEPLLRLNCGSRSERFMLQIKNEIAELIGES